MSSPTTIIWGELDSVAPLRTGILLHGLIERSTLHIIPRAEHVPIKSHSTAVVALMRDPVVGPKTPVKSVVDGTYPVLECHGKTGERYSGRYGHIVLNGCLDIHLVDVQASSVALTNSEADFVRLVVTGENTAIANGLFRCAANGCTARRARSD